MSEPLRLLVFGGRDYRDRLAVFAALDAAHAKQPVGLLIHGAAPGADSLADEWASARGVPRLRFEVTRSDWLTFGRKAGPLRNQRMIDEGKPTAAVGFPGGAGTADMRRRVLAAGIPLWEPLARDVERHGRRKAGK